MHWVFIHSLYTRVLCWLVCGQTQCVTLCYNLAKIIFWIMAMILLSEIIARGFIVSELAFFIIITVFMKNGK
jgi:hypothetical protein